MRSSVSNKKEIICTNLHLLHSPQMLVDTNTYIPLILHRILVLHSLKLIHHTILYYTPPTLTRITPPTVHIK